MNEVSVGDIVRFKDHCIPVGLGKIVRIDGDLFEVMTESGYGNKIKNGFVGRACVRDDFDRVEPQPIDWVPMGHRLPYGMWTCKDREVLFNRNYQPIWQRRTDFKSNVTRGDPKELVKGIVWEHWFYVEMPPWYYPDEAPWLEGVLADFFEGKSVEDRSVRTREWR